MESPESTPTLSRRQVLATAAASICPAVLPMPAAAPAPPPTALTDSPFLLGVASGAPLPDSVILWTRLVRDAYDAGSMGSRPVEVLWQVARDERFHRVVRSGVTAARPELAHSVHVNACGL